MSFSPFFRILFFAVLVGFGWLGYARVYAWEFPFWASGLLTGVWFLPALFAASLQARAGRPRPGWIFLSETLAALVSATGGPMGWVSLQFGFAQGLLGEMSFRLHASAYAVAVGTSLADLALLALHPAGFAAGQSTAGWLAHAGGVFFSALAWTWVIDTSVKKGGLDR